MEMENSKIQIPPSCLKELVVGDKTFRSSCDFHLTEADLEISRRELKETEEVRNESLRQLKNMLSRDEGIRYRMDDDYLLRYLRFRKFNIKESYKCIRNYYKMKMEYPDVFHMPPSVETLLNTNIGVLLPYTDEDGHLIYILKIGNWNTDEYDIRNMLQLVSLVSDIGSLNPHAQINGVIDIFDFAGTGLSHASQLLQPNNLRLWSKVMQEVHPWRLERIVFYNCTALQVGVFNVARAFLKKKIADRVTLLRSDVDQLHKYVNPTLLPKEYGGSLDDSECTAFIKRPILGNLRYLEYEYSFTKKS